MIQVALLASGSLLLLSAIAILGVWLRNERRRRQAFIVSMSENVRRRLDPNAALIQSRKLRELENATKIDQRMAELEKMISESPAGEGTPPKA